MKTKQFIIAIGASAGGLDQINKFFDFTPLDGVSYIVIQHLSADYKSMMATLLDKHSKLNIIEATNNMVVEINNVYLIPSAMVMTIEDGKLLLTEKLKGVNYTINTFFTSLAKERGNKAIGVILSGTGSDGTEGIKAIKTAGGLLMASSAESAEFHQMPQSAIDTGLVDYVIIPEAMPRVIEHYVKNKTEKTETVIAKNAVTEEEEIQIMKAITNLIKDKLPSDFTDYKKNTILRRIKRRASLYNDSSLESYLKLLENDTDELQNLANDFLISVTSFFRDKAAFELVEQTILPEIIDSKQPDDEIKMWVAGCASGEEAYSLAILLKENLEKAKKNIRIKIFATDIDKEALAIAGKGIYSEGITKDVSPERLNKYFTPQEKGFKINSSIREMLIFAYHDMTKNPPYCNMDFISCRNVLIYMEPILQKKVLTMLHFGLKYKGFLFLGPSENVNDIISSVELIDKKSKIYKNTEQRKFINFDTFMSPNLLELVSTLPKKEIIQHQKKSALQDNNIQPTVLEAMGFSGLWVNRDNQVLNYFGNKKYLLPEMFIHHLPELLSKSLQVAYSTAAMEADKTNGLIQVKGIAVAAIELPVTISVNPLANESGEATRLVLFNEESGGSVPNPSIQFDENLYNKKYAVNLEEELKITKEKLDTATEILQATNENMQSYNEELLSANEEMQSTNEEMQSVNEELQTINGEYHTKIKQLSDLNDDLNNYFRSNLNSQIFVNKDLMIMKFSSPTKNLINVLESDIGRPLSNISTNIKFETIDADIKNILVNGGVVNREIQSNKGNWFQVMTMPYLRKGDSEPDGAIITFNDITELKRIQQELAESNKSLKAINEDLDNFVYTASHDLLNPLINIEQLIYLIEDNEKSLNVETDEYIKIVSNSIRKLRDVIQEMTAIGNIESEILKVETINLEEMIGEILSSIQWKISSENADIKTTLAVRDIVFSKKNCRSMIYNLISNAIKFKSPDRQPKIFITTKDLPGYTLLQVNDNGIGINRLKINSIFKMYNRLNMETEGQGLGLFLINKIMNAAGGKIEVDSTPGEGTEFRLYLKK